MHTMIISGVVSSVPEARAFFSPVLEGRLAVSRKPSEDIRLTSHQGLVAEESENDLESMARLVRSNNRLGAELRSLRSRMRSAADYLTGPGSNVSLGAAYFDRLRARRSAILASLRSNRIEARALLASLS